MNLLEAFQHLEAGAPGNVEACVQMFEAVNGVEVEDFERADAASPVFNEALEAVDARIREILPNATESELRAFTSGLAVGLLVGSGVEIEYTSSPR